jgi:hypothetical protein
LLDNFFIAQLLLAFKGILAKVGAQAMAQARQNAWKRKSSIVL